MYMTKVLKLCSSCYSSLTAEDLKKSKFAKYDSDFRYVEIDCNECPKCGSELTPCNLTEAERILIAQTTDYSREVFIAMQKLKSDDPIEFALKLNQFKQFYENRKAEKRAENIRRNNDKSGKCPACGSKLIKRIGDFERVVSVTAFGLASKKMGKSFKCTTCGHCW